MRPLPRPAGPLPFDPETQLPKPLRRRRLRDIGQGCSIFCHYLHVLSQNLHPGIVLQGLEQFVLLENLLRSRRGVGRPRRSKSSTCSYISIDQHASVHVQATSCSEGLQTATASGEVSGRRSGLRGVRARCACTLPGFNSSLLSFFFLPRPRDTFLWSRRWVRSTRGRHMTSLPRRPFLRVQGAPAPDLGSLLQPALRPPSS